ncbi:hypothetical protein B0H14DRAFT_2574523, partial [Mycena olivaceomarginata]
MLACNIGGEGYMAKAHIPCVPASSLTLGLGCNHAVPGSRQCFIHVYIHVGYPYTAYTRGSADKLCHLPGLDVFGPLTRQFDCIHKVQAQDLLFQSAQSLLFWSAQLILVILSNEIYLFWSARLLLVILSVGIPSAIWAFPITTGNAHDTPQQWGYSQPQVGMPMTCLSNGGIPSHHWECPCHTSAMGEFPVTAHNGHYYHIWKCHGPSHFLDGNGHPYQ